MGIGLEPLSCNDTVPINYEQTLFQALVNEGRVSDVVIVCLSSVNLTCSTSIINSIVGAPISGRS